MCNNLKRDANFSADFQTCQKTTGQIITFLVITWFKCRFDAWCGPLTIFFSFFIVSKWRLVWHLSKLETFTVKLQRYFMKRDLADLKEGVITQMMYLCNFTMKVSNFDKCQTRRHFETIKFYFFCQCFASCIKSAFKSCYYQKSYYRRKWSKVIICVSQIITLIFVITFTFFCNNKTCNNFAFYTAFPSANKLSQFDNNFCKYLQ